MKYTNVADMTNGKTAGHIMRVAMPLLIGNLFQQLYNLVDSIVVGNYVGADALAAVGACGSINFLLFSLCAGLSIGIGIMVSQYFGAGEEDMVKCTIGNAMYVVLITAICTGMIGILFSPQILRIMSTPENIMGDAICYLRTTCAGIIAFALYNGVSSILRALGDSKTPLYFLILSSIVNVFCDLFFVIQFGWGVFGVAFATVIAQVVAAVTCLFYAYRKVPYFQLSKEQYKADRKIIRKTFQLGIPIALQNFMIALSCMVLQGVVNSYGNTVMTAYTIIGRIEQIIQQPYGSLATALTVFTGQNIGAGKLDRVKRGYYQSIIIVLGFSIIMIPIAWLFGGQIVGIFVRDVEVIAVAKRALCITSTCYFALGMIYIPRAILNGSGDTGFAMINGVTEVICRIFYSQIFIRVPVLGFWGIWVTTGATWITTAVICILRYASGNWKNKIIIKERNSINQNS